MSMMEIADASQVSRATLYNHYCDKESVLSALCESEMERIVTLAQTAGDATTALALISQEISQDQALAAMRRNDPEILTLAFSAQDHLLWKAFSVAITHIVGDEDKKALVVRWLLGQALSPLTPEQSRSQAQGITGIANL
jgi:AcrR family transcriptional regulator